MNPRFLSFALEGHFDPSAFRHEIVGQFFAGLFRQDPFDDHGGFVVRRHNSSGFIADCVMMIMMIIMEIRIEFRSGNPRYLRKGGNGMFVAVKDDVRVFRVVSVSRIGSHHGGGSSRRKGSNGIDRQHELYRPNNEREGCHRRRWIALP